MSRLECSGKSSEISQTLIVTPANAESHKSNDHVEKKTVIQEPRKRLPPCPQPHSGQKTPQSGSVRAEVLHSKGSAANESIIVTPRVQEQVESAAEADANLKKTNSSKAERSDSQTGGTTQAPLPGKPLPPRELNGEEEETEEEDVEDEDLKAPVELIMEFLRAVMDRDFQLAHKLCQMILIYEPENPEAGEFLPLIRKKLLEEQEAESSGDDDESECEDDESDGSDDSGSDTESSQSSSCSSSSSSDEDEHKETHVNRYKPCPPCHVHS